MSGLRSSFRFTNHALRVVLPHVNSAVCEIVPLVGCRFDISLESPGLQLARAYCVTVPAGRAHALGAEVGDFVGALQELFALVARVAVEALPLVLQLHRLRVVVVLHAHVLHPRLQLQVVNAFLSGHGVVISLIVFFSPLHEHVNLCL